MIRNGLIHITNRKDLHCHAKEFMLSCGDDNISHAQNLEILIFTR